MEECIQIFNDQKIVIQQEKIQFSFNKVFGPEYNQSQIYDDIGHETVKDVLQGYNGTILAYGPTGSGKTYSMFGNLDDRQNYGLIPRVCQQIFDHMIDDSNNYDIYCELLEIYNETLIDLLAINSQSELKIKESLYEGVYVQGLTRLPVLSLNELMQAIQLGNQQRKIKSTKINEYSSRSHTLLTIEIVTKCVSGSIESFQATKRKGRFNLVDLAGSEKVNKSGAVGITLDEARKINLSLSCLGNVIHALHNGNEHVPYRDSKLTRILQESLGGNYKTSMIVTCSSHINSLEETISTLKFANRAKSVKNYCKLNYKPLQNEVSQLSQELAQTRQELSNFKLALIRVKDHIYNQHQEHFKSHEKAIETVKVLDELINRPYYPQTRNSKTELSEITDCKYDEFNSHQQSQQNVIYPNYSEMQQNIGSNFNESSSNGNTVNIQTYNNIEFNSTKSPSIRSRDESMVPLLIQVKKDRNRDSTQQRKQQNSERIKEYEKQLTDLKLQVIIGDHQNEQLQDEINQLKLSQNKQKINNELTQAQCQLLQKLMQSMYEQISRQEAIIAQLQYEKHQEQAIIQSNLQNKQFKGQPHFEQMFKINNEPIIYDLSKHPSK